MPRLRKYVCPECSGSFEVLHPTSDDPPPRFCGRCGYDTQSAEPLVEPLPTPHIGKSIGGVVDNMYRGIEAGAEHRAHVAQAMGVSPEDAGGLKITDMRDNAREGEASNVPVVNDVTRLMDSLPKESVGFTGASDGVQYSGAVQSGPFPNAGARTMQRLRQMHSGQGFVTSDRPALETQMPNYRPRV